MLSLIIPPVKNIKPINPNKYINFDTKKYNYRWIKNFVVKQINIDNTPIILNYLSMYLLCCIFV